MLHPSDPDHQLLLENLARFARSPVAAAARQWDHEERFCHEALAPLAELGIWGATVPLAYGGSGMDCYGFALLVAQLAAVDGSLALTVASHVGLCCAHIALAGNEAQKRHYLPKLAAGASLGAWGLTEPGSGSDAVRMQTTAVRHADGWHLSGSKTFITQGTVADVYVVLAVTDRAAGSRGVTAFLLERGQAGFSQTPLKGKHGMRGSDTATLHFDDVVLGEERVLGPVGRGFSDTMQVLDRGRIAIAALALGLGRDALSQAQSYAEVRKQFGKSLHDFQAIQFKLADMATQLEAARLLVEQAARACDAGQPFGKAASMAKLFASEAAVAACQESLQIHGGYGYTNDFVVERHLRDARLCTIGEGTSEIQRMVIARHLRRERESTT